MEDHRGEYRYNWSYKGDSANDYRSKYTQGFDPDYLKHAAEKKRQEQEREKERRAASRPASRRRDHLTEQQKVAPPYRASRRRISQEQDPEEELFYEGVGDGSDAYERPSRRSGKRASGRQSPGRSGERRSRRKDAAYWRQVHVMRAVIYAGAVALLLFLILLAVNRHKLNIYIEGDNPLYVDYGDVFTDPGATAKYEGSIFHLRDREVAVTSTNDVDTSRYGTYQIRYRSSYKNKDAEAIRTVMIRDATPPVIRLNAAQNVVMRGAVWKDDFTAEDDQDGDVTARVEVTGTVDTSKNGTYDLTYRVTDAAGNTSIENRSVIVSNHAMNNPGLASEGDSNVLYLTFDDGPGPYTERLLNILDKYNAKATFFVTNQWPDYQDLMKREFESGHTVAVHTLTHNYDEIYSSDEAFWEDYNAMDEIVEAQTGGRSTILRFPGGSSNTVPGAAEGIMTRLTKQVKDKGLRYFDWDIDSGDASYEVTPEKVYDQLTGILSLEPQDRPDVGIILCHDLIEETVQAMEDFIPWCLDQGYVFLPMTVNTPAVEHPVQN